MQIWIFLLTWRRKISHTNITLVSFVYVLIVYLLMLWQTIGKYIELDFSSFMRQNYELEKQLMTAASIVGSGRMSVHTLNRWNIGRPFLPRDLLYLLSSYIIDVFCQTKNVLVWFKTYLQYFVGIIYNSIGYAIEYYKTIYLHL